MNQSQFVEYLKTGIADKKESKDGSLLLPGDCEVVDQRIRFRILRWIGFKRAGISIVNLIKEIIKLRNEHRTFQFAINQLSNI